MGELTANLMSHFRKFNIESICDVIRRMSYDTKNFMKLMKFTKQSPVFLEEQEEHLSIFNGEFKIKDPKVRVCPCPYLSLQALSALHLRTSQ